MVILTGKVISAQNTSIMQLPVGQSGKRWENDVVEILNTAQEVSVLVPLFTELLTQVENQTRYDLLEELDQMVQENGQPGYWPRLKLLVRVKYDL